MRRSLAAALAVGLLALAGCNGVSPPGESSVDVDTPKLRELKAEVGIENCVEGSGSSDLPAMTLPCLGGGPSVDLSTLSGPLLINLWGSYCGPCRTEMPVLQKFYEKYGDQVPVLGIDVEDTYPEAAISLTEFTGATYPQLADPGGDLYGQSDVAIVQGLPQFILIDADGKVAKQAAGGLDRLGEVVELVENGLGIDL